MSDNLMEKVISLGERLKISGTEYGQKVTAGVSSMSFKMKEFFQGPNQADKIVEEATAETLDEPDWATNLEICDLVNQEKINSVELIRGIKKRIMLKNPRIQYLSLMLLETIVKNCEKAFSEVASERVLDEMVKLVDDPQTVVNNRNKALMLIESWGESSNELRYLPVFEETYKSLRSRGIRFPGRDDESLAPIFTPPRSVSEAETNATLAQRDIPAQTYSEEVIKVAFDVARNSVELLSTVLSSSPQQDVLQHSMTDKLFEMCLIDLVVSFLNQDDLTTTLVQQCHESQTTIMRIIETAGDNEALLFEALSINDEVQKALSKYEDMKTPSSMVASALEPAMIPVAVEPEESPRAGKEDALVRKSGGGGRGTSQEGHHDDMMDDLDEMIFGKSGTTSSGGGVEPKKPDTAKDDLISF
ncbi:hypothetical protein KSS87_013887 [Heliosperma pusillum]|nr:hypothetical protein KSS87_003710 [Heliosperma pusillum]KAH9623824.1 hypothetical protein KSS87_013887 [Heliosperma pusillum]